MKDPETSWIVMFMQHKNLQLVLTLPLLSWSVSIALGKNLWLYDYFYSLPTVGTAYTVSSHVTNPIDLSLLFASTQYSSKKLMQLFRSTIWTLLLEGIDFFTIQFHLCYCQTLKTCLFLLQSLKCSKLLIFIVFNFRIIYVACSRRFWILVFFPKWHEYISVKRELLVGRAFDRHIRSLNKSHGVFIPFEKKQK